MSKWGGLGGLGGGFGDLGGCSGCGFGLGGIGPTLILGRSSQIPPHPAVQCSPL